MKIISTCRTALASMSLLCLGLSQPVHSNDWNGSGSSLTSTKLGTPHVGSSIPSHRGQNFKSASNSTQAVRQLFEKYKSLDLANNPQIINLYATDAAIDVLGTKYNKTSYGRYVADAYQNAASGLNSHTVYGEPNILVTNGSAQVSFTGALGPTIMYVYWNLRRNRSGVWQIASERFTKPAMSLTPANPAPAMNPQTPAMNPQNGWQDSMKQMNDNPDMKAFMEHMRKLQDQQKH